MTLFSKRLTDNCAARSFFGAVSSKTADLMDIIYAMAAKLATWASLRNPRTHCEMAGRAWLSPSGRQVYTYWISSRHSADERDIPSMAGQSRRYASTGVGEQEPHVSDLGSMPARPWFSKTRSRLLSVTRYSCAES